MQAMNFQDDISSIPFDNFKDHYVLVIDLHSMQDATEHSHYPELILEPLRLELYFSSPIKIVREVILLRERMSSVDYRVNLQSTSLVLWERIFEMDNTSHERILTVNLCSSIGTMDHFPQTLFRTSK